MQKIRAPMTAIVTAFVLIACAGTPPKTYVSDLGPAAASMMRAEATVATAEKAERTFITRSEAADRDYGRAQQAMETAEARLRKAEKDRREADTELSRVRKELADALALLSTREDTLRGEVGDGT